jgi:hypothetical protein
MNNTLFKSFKKFYYFYFNLIFFKYVTLLNIIVFLFVTDLTEDGRKRPKHVEGLHMFVKYIIVSNYVVVFGIYMMMFLTARNIGNFEQGKDLFK